MIRRPRIGGAAHGGASTAGRRAADLAALALRGGRAPAGLRCLHVLWGDLGEIRGLASKPSSLEIEGRIVHALLDEGRRLGLPAVFAFTYFPEFFIDLGFRVVPKDDLPRIAWKECIDCIHFPDCNETVVWFDL